MIEGTALGGISRERGDDLEVSRRSYRDAAGRPGHSYLMTRTERLADGLASRRQRGQSVRTEWRQCESSGMSKSVAVASEPPWVPKPTAPKAVSLISSRLVARCYSNRHGTHPAVSDVPASSLLAP